MKEFKGYSFEPFVSADQKSLINYCYTRFEGSEDVYNRQICLELIGARVPPEECLKLPVNTDSEKYFFTHFSKYKCLQYK